LVSPFSFDYSKNMAIRFYCPYCDRLLGIAQRRAGAVVECPSCHGKVGVPTGEASPPPPMPISGDFPAVSRAGIVLTRAQLLVLLLALGLMLGVSFAAGLLIGALT
jgi:hypothetical protein